MRHRGLLGAAAVAVVVTAVAALGLLVVLTGEDDGGGTSDGGAVASGDPLVVTTDLGAVRGEAQGGVRSFRGLPYAAPPVGDLRWQPPAPAASWSDVRDATAEAAPCLQPEPYDFGAKHLTVLPGSSEDCLHVDVARPDDDRTGLPVMVWLHGGGFFSGRADSAPYDSPAFVQRGIVVVSVDYRLGRFGFFAHPGLGGDTANFGLLDQVAALQWVQRNAEAFGGDPGQVTLAGNSAGGLSVDALMVAPAARGLFARAIVQSGLGAQPTRTFAQAEDAGEQAYPDLDAAALRALPASDLLDSSFNVFAGDAPLIDSVLPQSVAAGFAAGAEAPVPFLVGTTDAEFRDLDFRSLGVDPDDVRRTFGGSDHDAIVEAYGEHVYDKHVLDDVLFTAPALRLAAQHATRAPTYRYRFGVLKGGSPHTAEVPYVFDAESSPDQAALAHQVADYWTSFIATGTPSGPDLPVWPPADTGSAMLDFTPKGPKPHAIDPWIARLASLPVPSPAN